MTLNTIKSFLLSSILILLTSCKGQEMTGSDTSNALPIGKPTTQLDSNIWDIFQDSKGNYWFGTNNLGVYQFDGENFKKFLE